MSTTTTQAKNPVARLCDVLTEEHKLYSEYSDILAGDEQLMSHLLIDELEKSNKAKSTVLLKIQAMDHARETLVSEIAKNLQLKAEKVKLQEICTALPKLEAEPLYKIRDLLYSTLSQLKEIQGRTQALATGSLTWINGSMASLKNLLSPTATYNIQGQVESTTMFAGRTLERQA